MENRDPQRGFCSSPPAKRTGLSPLGLSTRHNCNSPAKPGSAVKKTRTKGEDSELRRVRKVDFSKHTKLGLAKAPSTRRNERERNRVRVINSTFGILQSYLPETYASDKKNQKLSKLDILRSAIDYINCLHDVLNDDHLLELRNSAEAQGSPVHSSPESVDGHVTQQCHAPMASPYHLAHAVNNNQSVVTSTPSYYTSSDLCVAPPSMLPPASAMIQHLSPEVYRSNSGHWRHEESPMDFSVPTRTAGVIEAQSEVDEAKITLTSLDNKNMHFVPTPQQSLFSTEQTAFENRIFSVSSLLS